VVKEFSFFFYYLILTVIICYHLFDCVRQIVKLESEMKGMDVNKKWTKEEI